MSDLPFHPDYGETNDIRRKVLRFIEATGCSASAAARKFGYHHSTVCGWVRRVKQQEERQC